MGHRPGDGVHLAATGLLHPDARIVLGQAFQIAIELGKREASKLDGRIHEGLLLGL